MRTRRQRPNQPMSDEQRRAMFWRLSQGGGGAWIQPAAARDYAGAMLGSAFGLTLGESYSLGILDDAAATQYNIQIVPKPRTSEEVRETLARLEASGSMDTGPWAMFRAAAGGFLEGFRGGSSILADEMTFGLADAVGLTDSGQYQGADYDFSRGASAVASTAAYSALGIGVLDKLGRAWAGTRAASSLLGKAAPGFVAVAGFGSKNAIDGYIEAHPTMDPWKEKTLSMASQLAGYVGSIGALGAAGRLAGAVSRRIPSLLPSQYGGSLSLADDVTESLGAIGAGFGKAGRAFTAALAKVSPRAVSGVGRAYRAYGAVADFTGSTVKEILSAPRTLANLRKAKNLMGKASSTVAKMGRIRAAEGLKEAAWRTEAARAFSQAATARAAGMPTAARTAYRQGVDSLWRAGDIAARAKGIVAKLGKEATGAAARSGALREAALSSLQKAAYAVGIAGAVTADEVRDIRRYADEAAAQYDRGERFALPMDAPRSTAGTIGAAAVGTLGNPVEKQFRGGQETGKAAFGAYLAGYRAIEAEAARQGWSESKTESEKARWAKKAKPQNMAGTGAWTIAPAAAAYLNWKVGDALDKGRRSEIAQRAPDSYIDGDTLELVGHAVIRLADMNAPEIAHGNIHDPDHPERTTGEMFGPEATAYADKIIRPRQWVRVVEDSHPEAGGLDAYGREVRTLETLPRPFDQLLRVPVLGKLLPAREFQEAMIRAGYADIDYRELTKYKGDNLERHDAARRAAQTAGLGIWSPKARQDSDLQRWVGTEETVTERKERRYAESHGGVGKPYLPATELSKTLGIGLMVSGNSGAFGPMGRTGQLLAQAWNGLMAGVGAEQYNEQAENAWERDVGAPDSHMTPYQIWLAEYRDQHPLPAPR